jgi:hypothetical protein
MAGLIRRLISRFRHDRLSNQDRLWDEERARAREAVAQAPDEVRAPVAAIVERFIEHERHSDALLGRDLDALDRFLSPYPDIRRRFFELRIVDDIVEALK